MDHLEGSLALLVSELPPCILFEDDHLLVGNKPAGLNTHAPSPYAGEGFYDWLRHREPRWSSLAIIHRLDKETSGVLLFTKTPLANRSLTEQFTTRTVRKKYLLFTDHPVAQDQFTVRSSLVRVGDHYMSRPHAAGAEAETRFRVTNRAPHRTVLEAEPLTGRTHQIRVHAADRGCPILGDALYGGTRASRVYLHAAELTVRHPATHVELVFKAEPSFELDPRTALRDALFNADTTDSYRIIHGAADGWPGFYLDRLGEFALCASEDDLVPSHSSLVSSKQDSAALLEAWMERYQIRGVYYKLLARQPGKASLASSSPRLLLGQPAPDEFVVRENGHRFALRFKEGYSIGLFLDQRDNRRRLLVNHVAADWPAFSRSPETAQVLNTFSYTCAFSVCAAKAGARTTSLDLSRNYLEWGQRNFRLNGLDPARHEFISGDAFDWMRRLARKGRGFDLIILDPPTFSRSKEHGPFQVEKDYPSLVALALPLLKAGGVLLASTNLASLKPESFFQMILRPIKASKRRVTQQHYAPQPPDFPITRDEPAHLKTVWMRFE